MVYNADGTVTPFEMDGCRWTDSCTGDRGRTDPCGRIARRFCPGPPPRRLRDLEPFIASTSAAGCGADGLVDGRIDWIGAVANRLPMTVVAHLIGLPHE